MATKREEMKAFRRLQKEFPGEYVSLTLNYYGTETMNSKYSAYHEGKKGEEGATTIIARCLTPNEAVDVLVKMREKP